VQVIWNSVELWKGCGRSSFLSLFSLTLLFAFLSPHRGNPKSSQPLLSTQLYRTHGRRSVISSSHVASHECMLLRIIVLCAYFVYYEPFCVYTHWAGVRYLLSAHSCLWESLLEYECLCRYLLVCVTHWTVWHTLCQMPTIGNTFLCLAKLTKEMTTAVTMVTEWLKKKTEKKKLMKPLKSMSKSYFSLK